MLASAGGSEACTRALLDAGASKELKTRDGKTAAMLAFERQSEELATSGSMIKDYTSVLCALGAAGESLQAGGPSADALSGPGADALRKQLEAVEREKAALHEELEQARAESRKHQQALEISQSEKDALAKAKADALVCLLACGTVRRSLNPTHRGASHRARPAKTPSTLRPQDTASKLNAQLIHAEAKAASLSPLLNEAEENVRVLTAEVHRVEGDLGDVISRSRARVLATPPARTDAATATPFIETRAPVPAPSPSELMTPLKESRAQPVRQTPSHALRSTPTADAHRRAVDAALVAITASPSKRPPLDALQLGSHRRAVDGLLHRTPSSARTMPAAVNPAPTLSTLLLRRT
jgi:hypothetical protein